jgi:alcohol dehydrogenase class IV
MKTPSIYQDRLGTNIGKALKNRPFSQVLKLMDATGVPMGISKLGFGREDIPALVAGTLPQVRPLALLCLALSCAR